MPKKQGCKQQEMGQFPDSRSTGSNYVVGGRTEDHFHYADFPVAIFPSMSQSAIWRDPRIPPAKSVFPELIVGDGQ